MYKMCGLDNDYIKPVSLQILKVLTSQLTKISNVSSTKVTTLVGEH